MVPRAHDIVTGSIVTRPADTTAYASGDLIANSTTAGSVVPISFANVQRNAGGLARLRRVRLRKTGAGVANCTIRVHLFTAAPTVSSGDNAAIVIATGAAAYVGAVDVVVGQSFTDGAAGQLAADIITFGNTLYGLMEARGAYAPASGETFTVSLELDQD
jgi:hypothetical protein